jgi:uncharacterized protein (DUF885 family)
MLQHHTSTLLSAEEIHNIGQTKVKEISLQIKE